MSMPRFSNAEVIVEREFRTPRVHQVYLEPHTAVVDIDDEGPRPYLDVLPDAHRTPPPPGPRDGPPA